MGFSMWGARRRLTRVGTGFRRRNGRDADAPRSPAEVLPISATLKVNSEQIQKQLHAELEKRLKTCGEIVTADCTRILGISGHGKGSKGKRNNSASAPGQPPHADTANLKRSIRWEFSSSPGEMIVRIGSPVKYGLFLELGTRRMAARPWLRPSFLRMMPRIRAILNKKIDFRG